MGNKVPGLGICESRYGSADVERETEVLHFIITLVL